MASILGYRSLFDQESLSTKSIGRKCFSWHVKNKEAKGLFGFFFFFCHHSLLFTQFLPLITYHLKYPNFPNPTHLALITQFCCYFLFQKKAEMSRYAVGLCFQKKKKNPKVKHCSWIVRVVSLITEMSLKTKLWKIKTPEMWFSFP